MYVYVCMTVCMCMYTKRSMTVCVLECVFVFVGLTGGKVSTGSFSPKEQHWNLLYHSTCTLQKLGG